MACIFTKGWIPAQVFSIAAEYLRGPSNILEDLPMADSVLVIFGDRRNNDVY